MTANVIGGYKVNYFSTIHKDKFLLAYRNPIILDVPCHHVTS